MGTDFDNFRPERSDGAFSTGLPVVFRAKNHPGSPLTMLVWILLRLPEKARRRVNTGMYVYGYHILQSMDQPGKVANPARGQLNRENKYFPVPFAAENSVSRDGFSRPVPRQPAHSLYSG